ncbi:MAG: NFACT family protein [Candidatus Micrarchaeia archaeon]
MHKMSNLEFFFIAKELSGSLAGKHFSRIRKLGDGIYRMKIGTLEILAESGVRIHATKYIETSDETDKFVEKLNKELDNGRLIFVEQLNQDRIVSFNFDKGQLVFEMFGGGNVILVQGGTTVCAQKYESWSDREIKAGSPYSPPKNVPSALLEVSEKYIIVSLMKLPLGKEYALEALRRAGIDEKLPGSSLSGNRILSLEREISLIRENAAPYGFFDNGRLVDFSLTRLSAYSGLETRSFQTLSEAADEYYHSYEKPNPLLEKLTERLSKQKERIAALETEEKDHRAKGDMIYQHYQLAEEILSMAKAGKFPEIEARFAARIDKKEKSIELDLQ